ncbi:lipase [Stenotrophomonas maltophilia]|uniref:XVIPCD domain-containing protein n=1 Tax=Stenotrophomonas maltophilia group TaxID=995085 RepID=UPI000D43B222|nr:MULTISPECIES: XVIPCD domain-containing protein [Stenotrophomonas maltophilia group]MCF3498590.1 lipase [Stenotrophomonas maltophilia]MDQ4678496.1 lipase [Stenotrophomonas maltophilia group sp. RNC7]PSD20779.1 lipase [Stenotrophomonas maltophilia]UGB20211.1 lipase [Stenotrophomonas maltophilia]
MSLSSQDYAGISDDVYKDRAVGRRAPGKEELVAINGHEYKILEHVDNRLNGYQGTIYQRVDTNEIVVAHRGTEQIARDAILTDGGMVVARTNVQAPDAIALTQRALAYAKKEGQDLGQRPPEVTVTGHSLGGALAQITSHHFNVKGETFNAYGAVSLSYRIPEGGNTMINHVMASDPVSAASPHFGQVRIYARPNEISTLAANGFSNHSLRALIPDRPIIAAGSSFGAHKLGNFLGDGSVLQHPETQKLAKDNARMIEEYRDDVESLRRGVTRAARGIPGGAVDLYDHIRGPLQPGEPARREAEKNGHHTNMLRMDDANHVGNPLFNDAIRGVHAQDVRVGRVPDVMSTQLAGSLAAEMHAAGGKRIDEVVMNADASRSFAVQGQGGDPAHLRVSVDTAVAMNTPLEQSSQRIDQQAADQRVALERDQQLEQQRNQTRSLQA